VSTGLNARARGRVLGAGAMDAHNTFERPQAVVPAPYAADPAQGQLVLALPPMSIVVVSLEDLR